jgi:hypothetical protein
MSSRLIARRDLVFLLHEWLDVASLWVRPRFDLPVGFGDTTLGMQYEWS